jgi:hypothetical protein
MLFLHQPIKEVPAGESKVQSLARRGLRPGEVEPSVAFDSPSHHASPRLAQRFLEREENLTHGEGVSRFKARVEARAAGMPKAQNEWLVAGLS